MTRFVEDRCRIEEGDGAVRPDGAGDIGLISFRNLVVSVAVRPGEYNI